jgi:hypothetical protein
MRRGGYEWAGWGHIKKSSACFNRWYGPNAGTLHNLTMNHPPGSKAWWGRGSSRDVMTLLLRDKLLHTSWAVHDAEPSRSDASVLTYLWKGVVRTSGSYAAQHARHLATVASRVGRAPTLILVAMGAYDSQVRHHHQPHGLSALFAHSPQQTLHPEPDVSRPSTLSLMPCSPCATNDLARYGRSGKRRRRSRVASRASSRASRSAGQLPRPPHRSSSPSAPHRALASASTRCTWVTRHGTTITTTWTTRRRCDRTRAPLTQCTPHPLHGVHSSHCWRCTVCVMALHCALRQARARCRRQPLGALSRHGAAHAQRAAAALVTLPLRPAGREGGGGARADRAPRPRRELTRAQYVGCSVCTTWSRLSSARGRVPRVEH